MRKIKTLIIITFISFIFATPKVFAYNALVTYPGRSEDTGIRISPYGNASKDVFKQRRYEVIYGGKKYEGFCLDPGLVGPTDVTCSPYDGDAGLIWLLQEFKGVSDNNLKLLTFRMYGIYSDLTKTEDKELQGDKAAIIRFLQIKDGDQEAIRQYGTDPYIFLSGNTALIDQAYELANRARSVGGGNLEESNGGSITVGQKSVNGLTATYPLSSNAEIKPEYIDFECENCTILNKDWQGTTGSITLVANQCDKDYNLVIVYKASNTNSYMCSNGQRKTQTIFMISDGNGNEEVKVPYPDKIACDGENCCTDDPIEPGWIGGNVNNCCEDGGTSEAHEYDLDKLFCRDGTLKVDYYKPKCRTDYYVQENTSLNEKYCKMYCTERFSIEIPGPITATSGRYFQLTTTSHNTKSPYIEGFKRCRIRVQYDIWENDYHEAVKKEINAYNDFQYNEAYNKMYDDAINNGRQPSQETSQITCNASCTITYSSSSCKDNTCKETLSAPEKSDTCTIDYNKYNFRSMYNYYYVKLDEGKRNNFTEYEIIKNGSGKTLHRDWNSWDINTKKCNDKIDEMQKNITLTSTNGRGSCTATYSCTRTTTTAEQNQENVYSMRDSYAAKANSANSSYNAAAREAKQLEQDIDRCDNYFTKYEGANAQQNYDFNTSMEFSYTQVYMDNDRGLQVDEQYIQFEDTPGCVITGPTLGPDGVDNLSGKKYSEEYKTGTEKLVDFKEALLTYDATSEGYKNYRDTQYNADKVFTHDAKYRAECSWNEGANVYYTLSPSGAVSESTDLINFKEHGQEYRLFLSTLDGTYETHWKIVGLGSRNKNTGKGKFDNFFANQGNTCANESPSESSMLTCKLHVEYEIVLTGYCNGSNGTDTTVDVGDCDPYKEGYNLFAFKVVDPANLFPNGYSTDAGNVGYNWSSTEKGQAVLKEIQDREKDGKTFDLDNLTYSFRLTPTDMGHVKNYNAQANANGGYSDFNMNCNCSGDSCINCKSPFLSELANGNVIYDGQNHSVSGWSNKQNNLDGIRRKYGW